MYVQVFAQQQTTMHALASLETKPASQLGICCTWTVVLVAIVGTCLPYYMYKQYLAAFVRVGTPLVVTRNMPGLLLPTRYLVYGDLPWP